MKHRTLLYISFLFFACNKPEELPIFEGDLLNMINQVNPGYTIDNRLMKAAEMQVEHMALVGNIDHEWEDRTGLAERLSMCEFLGAAGECTARGQRTEAEVMESWMNSEGHRRIIMAGFNRVGYARKDNYWCLVVGLR